MKPDGVFLSNGPGDPAATGRYAIKIIKTLIKKELLIQFKNTDLSYKKLLYLINLKSTTKEDIILEIGHKNRPSIKKIIYLLV